MLEKAYLVHQPAKTCQAEKSPLVLSHANVLDGLIDQSGLCFKDCIVACTLEVFQCLGVRLVALVEGGGGCELTSRKSRCYLHLFFFLIHEC